MLFLGLLLADVPGLPATPSTVDTRGGVVWRVGHGEWAGGQEDFRREGGNGVDVPLYGGLEGGQGRTSRADANPA